MTAAFDIDATLKRPDFSLEWKLKSRAGWLGLFGASGAGKTTALELALGWLKPTTGHLQIPAAKRSLGYAPQDLLLFPHWTVEANLKSASHGGSHLDQGLYGRVLDALDLADLLRKYAGRLSGGEGRRVALARAILAAANGGLLVLDEPLSSLDRERRRRVLGLLLELKRAGSCTALVVSHTASDLQLLCDEVQVLEASGERSRFGAAGPPSEVLAEAGGFENLTEGVVLDREGDSATCGLQNTTTAQTGSDELLKITIPSRGLEVGDRVVIGLRADDVLVTLDDPGRVSARNVLGGVVRSVRPFSSYRTLEVEIHGASGSAPRFLTHITEGAEGDLGVTVGTNLYLLFKTRSLEVLAVNSQGALS